MSEISKTYNPKETESRIYRLWEKSGFFNPDKLPRSKKIKEKFVVTIAPLNVTGEAHMGHALENSLLDILVRRERMLGKKVLWVPGTDHAGIATQNVVEKELKKEGKTRFDLGREKFTERVWQWVDKYGSIILDQLKKLGLSCDWSRTRFTMDKEYVRAVEKAFLHYYKKGWIYKGRRVINWCPRCQTSLSDLELEYKEEKSYLWYIKYPLKNPKQPKNYIAVATTRPETMLGDAAVAVNPKDKRYKSFIGERVILPLAEREIPIIADILIDPDFGTGAVKITPAHDLTDYEIALRHKLPLLQVIDEKGRITKETPLLYQGLSIREARQKVVEDLEKIGLLEKTEDYSHQVPVCYRCGTLVELIPSEQWFLKMKELAKMAIKAVKNDKVEFIPKNFEKIYFNWLENIQDWCISRQIWWGHKIPIKGVDDVLDTWFSSALWPFAVMGWPEKTRDFKEFYPTQLISSDRGIINLWHARMIFSGLEFTNAPPFPKIYIHATVLTKEGKRMSKSLGTGVDPLALVEKYGADATRFGIAYQVMGGQDIKFIEDNIIMGKKFCNKIWNASRFILMQKLTPIDTGKKITLNIKKLTGADKKILSQLREVIKSINNDLDNFRFGKAAHKLYNFFWHDFCDKYIEQSKNQMESESAQKILLYVLSNSLKLLHPFIPFITEEIYQKLPLKNKRSFLMIEGWPR